MGVASSLQKMILILFLMFIASSAFAADPGACLQLNHFRQATAFWPDEIEHPGGFFWVETKNKCGRDLGRLYIVISFWDAKHEHITDSFWPYDFTVVGRVVRFSAPPMTRPYKSISVVKITSSLEDAICATDAKRCP